MSDTATDLIPEEQATPEPEPHAQAQGDGDPAPLQIEDDAAVDAVLEQDALAVPGGDKLVSASQVTQAYQAYRGKIRDLKTELESVKTTAAESATLKQQIAQLQSQMQQMQPYVSAYQAMTQAAQQTVTPEDESEAEEYAKLLDLYTTEGKPDVGRAKKAIALFDKRAKSYAEQSVAPIQQQTVNQQSAYYLSRATNTAIGDVKADPEILRAVWSRLDPSVTASPEGAQHALIQAIGLTVLRQQQGGQAGQPTTTQRPRTATGQFTGQPVGDPLFIEKAGGKESTEVPLDAKEQAYIKAAGITEKEYRESAKSAPWLNRR
jgi:hypothetical protein